MESTNFVGMKEQSQAFCIKVMKYVYRFIAIIKYCLFCLKTKLILNIILIVDAKYCHYSGEK